MSKKTLLIINGINGASGEYDLPPQRPQDVAKVARGLPLDPAEKQDVQRRRSLDQRSEAFFGSLPSVNAFGLQGDKEPKDLSQAGWGVIFPAALEAGQLAALKEALQPLLVHRQAQAAAVKAHYYKECSGELGYQLGKSKNDFLELFNRTPGPADPEKLPYYLLIVGDPEQIPYSFQYQLDVQYAVGRIFFEHLEDYNRYANWVVEAEKKQYQLKKKAAFFGVANPDDGATQLSSQRLIAPLAEYIRNEKPDWQVQVNQAEQSYKNDLDQMLRSKDAPAFLFTASHGMAFPNGDPRQFPHQGALLCQDWPGPKAYKGRIPEDFYFSGEDLSPDANLLGTLAFFFACYGAGTPRLDDFNRINFIDKKEIAPRAFLSQLPTRMLAHPKGGALAVVGHVERAWGYSFVWEGVDQDLTTFESTLTRLMDGHPIGSALEHLNSRYAELASDLTTELDETDEETQNVVKIAGMWTANHDARNYMVLGDPAVRLMVGKQVSPPEERASITETLGHVPQVSSGAAAAPVAVAAGMAAAGNAVTGTAAAGTVAAGDLAATDYGLGDTLASLRGGLQQLGTKLGDFLSKALDDATSLEVSTYVSDNISAVKYENGKFSGASLRAVTRVNIDGDTIVCVPEEDGEVDLDLWNIHLQMLQQAQTSRSELLKTAVSAVTGLTGLLKP
jgi:hypothetical protein